VGDLFESLLGGAGWGLGIGVAIGAVTVAGKGLRPIVKEAIKAGMAAGERVQGWTAEAREQFDDIIAEAKAERSPLITDATGAEAASSGRSGGEG
jgi:hypothetical protein